jgi:hypothetical protein
VYYQILNDLQVKPKYHIKPRPPKKSSCLPTTPGIPQIDWHERRDEHKHRKQNYNTLLNT